MASHPKNSTFKPLSTMAAIPAAVMGLGVMLAIFFDKEYALFGRLALGSDFAWFVDGAKMVKGNLSPYLSGGYVTPPFAAQVISAMGLAFADPTYLAQGMMLFTAACLAGSFAALWHLFGKRWPSWTEWAWFGLLSCTSYPVMFLLGRGNVDGVVLALTVAVIALAMQSEKFGLQSTRGRALDLAAGLILACGVGVKIYPVLFLLPLAFLGRWWIIAGTVVTLGGMVASAPGDWQSFLIERVLFRSSWSGEGHECAGIFSFFHWLTNYSNGIFGTTFEHSVARLWGAGFYILALTSFSWWLIKRAPDRLRTIPAVFALFGPFAVAIPDVSYAYMVVQVTVLIAFVSIHPAGRLINRRWAALGIGLLHPNWFAVEVAWRGWIPEHLFGGANGIGSFVLLGGLLWMSARYWVARLPIANSGSGTPIFKTAQSSDDPSSLIRHDERVS